MQSNGERNGDELDGIKTQMNKTTNESLESTRRMVGLVAESQEVGVNTMVMLDDQGEKLNRIEVKYLI
jgi:synaptosomal-associated protein 25